MIFASTINRVRYQKQIQEVTVGQVLFYWLSEYKKKGYLSVCRTGDVGRIKTLLATVCQDHKSDLFNGGPSLVAEP
jgi:hypothetical protein